jgi:hypothetical protein
MQIDNFISYLLEIGILDIENKQILLNIYNNIKNKANNEIENDIIKISFFSYIRTLAKEDKKLFELCRRIIFTYNQRGNKTRNNFINILNQLLMYKLRNIFNDLIIKLNLFSHVNNIYKVKNNKSINYSDNKINKSSRPISYQNLRLNTNSSENESVYSNNLNYIINNNNIKSYTYYSPAVDVISKSSNKNYNSPYYNTDNNVYNNTVSNFYLNNKTNHNKNDIYLNNIDFTKKINDKIITMKLNKIKDENKELTFHPKINKNYKINPNHSEIKNNIRLHKNNSKENEKTRENSQNAIFTKLYNDGKKKKDFIEKILKEEKNDFIPKINKNYKVSTTFSQRTNKSIMNKNKNFIKQNSLNTKINENKKKLENLKKNELYKIKNNNEKDNKKNTNNFISNLQNNKNNEKYNENNNNNINEKQIFEINEKNPNINSKIIENKINNIEPKEENNLNFVKSNETNKNNNYNMIKNNNFTDIQSLSDVNSNINSNNFLNNSMISNAKKEEESNENKLYSKENTYESKTLKELLKINKDNLK